MVNLWLSRQAPAAKSITETAGKRIAGREILGSKFQPTVSIVGTGTDEYTQRF
jgi:hypothetical protein